MWEVLLQSLMTSLISHMWSVARVTGYTGNMFESEMAEFDFKIKRR